MLVETSALIPFLRGSGSPAAARVSAVARTGRPLLLPTFCVEEVLQGARDEREWMRLQAWLELQVTVAVLDPWESHVEAARIYYDARRKGLTVRSTVDCLIAQIAIEQQLPLVHDDDDFEAIRLVRPNLALVR